MNVLKDASIWQTGLALIGIIVLFALLFKGPKIWEWFAELFQQYNWKFIVGGALACLIVVYCVLRFSPDLVGTALKYWQLSLIAGVASFIVAKRSKKWFEETVMFSNEKSMGAAMLIFIASLLFHGVLAYIGGLWGALSATCIVGSVMAGVWRGGNDAYIGGMTRKKAFGRGLLVTGIMAPLLLGALVGIRSLLPASNPSGPQGTQQTTNQGTNNANQTSTADDSIPGDKAKAAAPEVKIRISGAFTRIDPLLVKRTKELLEQMKDLNGRLAVVLPALKEAEAKGKLSPDGSPDKGLVEEQWYSAAGFRHYDAPFSNKALANAELVITEIEKRHKLGLSTQGEQYQLEANHEALRTAHGYDKPHEFLPSEWAPPEGQWSLKMKVEFLEALLKKVNAAE